MPKLNSLLIALMIVFNLPVQRTTAQSMGKESPVYLGDPTILNNRGVYYLYGTGQASDKGFTVLTSLDLKTWVQPNTGRDGGIVLEKGSKTFGSKGFWAPQIVAINNKFCMLYTANENIAIAWSNSPNGPFVQNKVSPLSPDTKQIDPFLFIDDNGKKYLYHVRLGGGNKIYVAELKDDFSGIYDKTLTLCITAEAGWENTKGVSQAPITEGPTVIKHKGLYYLFYSANDFRNTDYAVGYATSKSPLGPWKKYYKNPIISRSMIGHNGTGHGDLFKDTKGQYQYVFHVYNSDSTVSPRKTFITGLKFIPNKKTGIDEISIVKNSLITPVEVKE